MHLMAIFLDVNHLRRELGRQLTHDEIESLMQYAAWAQRPKPKPEDSEYHQFMTVRCRAFLIYREAVKRSGKDTTEFDEVLSEYQPS